MRRLLLLVLVAGCSEPVTEIVLKISQVGINIPRDIDVVRINAGPDKFDPDRYAGQPVYLCEAFPTIEGCKHLPLTATLIPGAMTPGAPVRLEVQAKLHGDTDNSVVRIRDVVNFKFTPGRSLRLELVLTTNCLDDPLRCADAESACYQFGCYNPQPEEPNADLAVVLDLSTPRDLAGVDLQGVDLACSPNCPAGYCGIDKNNCGVACTCAPNSFTTCGAGQMCVPCGANNQTCCPTAPRCQSQTFACDSPDISGKCVPCVAQGGGCTNGGQPCCAGSVCDGSSCVRCGQMMGDPCCAGDTCNTGLVCNGTNCQPCGAVAQACCQAPEQPCHPGSGCTTVGPGIDQCQPCGADGQQCCSGAMCSNPGSGCNMSNNCAPCGGAVGAACCASCGPGFECSGSGYCDQCGQVENGFCCGNGFCANTWVCFQGRCVPPDMAQNMNDLSLLTCGEHIQPCCPQPSSPPDCNHNWLVCNITCVCGGFGQPCCQDGVPPCMTPLSCNLNTDPGSCVFADLKGTLLMCVGNNGLPGDDCCYMGIYDKCAPGYFCCLAPSCTTSSGSALSHTCYTP